MALRKRAASVHNVSMKVKIINKDKYLTTTFLDPSPMRFRPEEPPLSGRRIPLIYICDNCEQEVGIDEADMKKHFNLGFSNLGEADNAPFRRYVDDERISATSFLDFYCPRCNQATKIFFDGGIWGRGEFGFTIDCVLVLKKDSC